MLCRSEFLELSCKSAVWYHSTHNLKRLRNQLLASSGKKKSKSELYFGCTVILSMGKVRKNNE